jgi:predicted alpha/beta-hydrolase family hydrolase
MLFAHGANVPSSHPWMQSWARRLSGVGQVSLFDYPYVKQGRRTPDAREVLIAAHRDALEQARRTTARPVVLVGKSMGARLSCELSLTEQVTAVVSLGFPLSAQGRRGDRPDELIAKLSVPALFIQGSQDPLGPIEALELSRRQMKAPSELFVVDGGDHSLRVSGAVLEASGESQDDVDSRVLQAIDRFVARILKDR